MRLELYIRGHFIVSVELTPPNDPDLDWNDNVAIREEFVNWKIKALKVKYQRAIENSEWEVRRVFESKVGKILEFENYLQAVN